MTTAEDQIEDIYELTPMQQGMLFHSLLDPSAGMYVEQMTCDVRGDLPLARWQDAWQRVLARHPVLRSGFMWEGLEKPVQVVSREARLAWHVEDLRGAAPDAQEQRIEDFLREDRRRGFALDAAPLVRCALFRLDEVRHRFVWTYHHLLLDGWCFSIVLREVLEVVESGTEALPPPARPYRDYIAWLQEQDPAPAEKFWRSALAGFDQPTPLPFLQRQEESGSSGDAQPQVIRNLPAELTGRLAAFAKEERLTLNTLVQAAWALVLGRAADRDDVVFGVTVSGRPAELEGAESIVGLFINTVPLRARLDDDAPVSAFLSSVQASQGALEPCGYSSLADIQVWSDAPHDRPLFDSLMVFENYPIDRSALLERSDLEISAITTYERTNYPLTLVAIPGESLELRVMFDAGLFSRAAAERITGLLEAALSAFAAGTKGQTLGEIDLLDEAGRRALEDWSRNPRPFDTEVPVPERVAARARRDPDATALVGTDGRRVSYRELEEQAERVAQRLRAVGVGRETIVGVAIGRSVELVAGLLGVLKAGGAYLPLDPSYPSQRLAFIVGDAAPQAILIAGADPIPGSTIPRLDVAAIAAEAGAPAFAREPARADDLAYVIYTSGSTGAPKGVMVTHRSLANLVSWHTEAFSLTAKDRTTQLASVAFDASAWEIWPTLAAGATLCLVPPHLSAAPPELSRWLVDHEITISFLPTPVAEAALSLAWPPGTALRFLLTGGDRLHAFPPPGLPFQLVNNYGPTEITIVATSGPVGPPAGGGALPSIGRPVANARVYVLDRRRRPVLPGVVGELYIGGAGVARGYLNRPELTAARFVPDPFCGAPDARMYASGDLASFFPDGTLAFHGRSDRQVQVLGVRVEPGEIEAALAGHPSVAAAAVVSEDALQNGDVRLVAFAAGRPESPTDAAALASHLARRLPPPMLPSRIVLVDELPLTPNGKVDHAALVARARETRAAADHVAPRTPHEEVVAGIWSAVLGRERIGVNDDFFAIGGHSLKATQVIARAREVFGVDLPVRLIFERRTIAAFAEAIAGGRAGLESIPRVDLTGDVPAAPGQERLWFLDALSGASSAYNVPLVLRLTGALDVAALRKALEVLVDRHDALRTTFADRSGHPVQRIARRSAEVLTVDDVDPLQVDERVKEEVNTPFSLTAGPLFRARLLRLRGRDEHVLVINQHHIVADAWSLAILLRELGHAYAAFSAQRSPELPELPIRYADWAAWQHGRLSTGQLDESLAFWRKALAAAPPCLTLPADRPRPREQSFRGSTKSFTLAAPLGRRLEELARSAGASLFMTLLGAFAAYLGRISGQDDVVVGVPAANRDRRETEGVVGFFLNTLAIRIDLSGNPTFAELVQRVRRSALEAYAHQDVPFERVVAALGAPRDLGHNPLFQVMFTIQPESSSEMRLGDLQVEMPPFETTTSKFDLALVVEPKDEGLACAFEYSTDLFDEARMVQMSAHLENALQAVARDPDLPLLEIPILSAEERRRIVAWSRGPRKDRPFRAAVPELIAEHARATPEAPALIGPDGATLSYRDLDARAGAVARRLRAMGVGPETIVGVCIERSLELVVGQLAVWKAGGAYLPLDPGYASDRLAFIAGDAAPRVILTRGAVDPIVDRTIPRLDVLGRLDEGGPAEAPAATRPDDLAYVIYTSGSTGVPKGVLVSQRNLHNTVLWHNDHFELGPADRCTQLASVAFDATVWEIWPPLAAGAALYVVPAELVPQPAALADWIAASGITLCFLPTPLAEAALARPWPEGGSLRVMHVAGDRLHIFAPPGLPFALSNAYGPTETTVCATTGVVPEGGEGLPSIGRPIGNTAVYILDEARRAVPPGVVGEMFIGGAGVARGYLNRPDLTEERFLPDPFWDDPAPGPLGARMYASGDLGSFNPDGTIAFHGRRDRQIKVRGVRVEPAEIEAALAEHPGIEAAAVVTQGSGVDLQLLAFAAARPGAQPSTSDVLASYLAAKLPAAMVPSRILVVDDLPLTPNGKVDYAALAARATESEGRVHVPPRTPEEEVLTGIWTEVLGRTPPGVTADFFELGGHSLRATQVVSRIREAFGVELPVRVIFERKTIARLAEAVSTPGASAEPIPRADLSGDLPLAPGQESLWFIDALGGGNAAYNVPLVLRLGGALDAGALARAIALLVERHEALRTTFHDSSGGTPVQRIGPPPSAPSVLAIEDVEPAFLDRRIAEEIAAPFSLATGPLFRARLLRLRPDEHVLVINQHHIIVDAWSIGVLLRELCVAYAAFASGAEPALPDPPIRYADWACWQRRRLESGRLEQSLAYWRGALKGAPGTVNLPGDRPRPERPSFRGKTRSFVLPAPAGQRLEELATRSGASLFMTLLGAFAAYLGRISGQEDVVVGSPAANRDRRETEGVVGYFLNTLAFRVDLAGDPTFAEVVARVRKTALEAYAHQDVPFEKLVAGLGVPRALGHNPLFQVMFVIQGQGGGDIRLPGLSVDLPAFESPTSKFDLTLFVEPREGALACVLEYSTDLFDDDRIERMAAHLGRLLEAVIARPELRLSEIPLLSADEQRLIADLNRTERAYDPGRTLPQLFASQASQTPDRVALEHGRETRTYRQLDQEAEALADRLAALGVGPGARVAFCLDRSIAALTSMLATLKAGGAYVPLDPSYPPERLRYMLESAQASVLVTEKRYRDLLPAAGVEVILADEAEARAAARRAPPKLQAHHLAYVLYTSGSTGKPKGVAMPHRALVNLIECGRSSSRRSASTSRSRRPSPPGAPGARWSSSTRPPAATPTRSSSSSTGRGSSASSSPPWRSTTWPRRPCGPAAWSRASRR
ncbi:MAG: hypothetical protein DMF81_06875 [Acidobacteria bacterium]|nr:MAG: hypothetical protein DMF81_06875 [Acidobacteriota bacterium]